MRKCLACGHSGRPGIDSAILAGVAFRRISADFDITESSLRRHREHIRKAIDQVEGDISARLIGRLETLERTAGELLAEARTDSDRRGSIAALLANVKILETISRILEVRELETRVKALEEALTHEQQTIQ